MLFHDGQHGTPLIDALARHGDGLPANVLPLAVNEVTQVGLEAIVAAFAYGAAGVRFLLRAKPLHDIAGLSQTMPAVDFSQYMWEGFSADVRHTIETEGKWLRPSEYSPEPYPITRQLIEEGKNHLLLGGTIRTYAPVHILQGMRDSDVPWRRATLLIEHLAGDPAVLTLVKDGDHRLSREEDLQRLFAAIEAMD